MLKSLRKNTKLIIWTVIIAFSLWGGYSVGQQFQKQGRVAGEIFGKEVSFQEFNRFLRASEIFTFTGNTPKDPEAVREHAWQNLIFSKEAHRRRVEVTDEEVRQEVLRLLALQKIENPSPQAYKRWVEGAFRESARDFESQIRELLRVQRLIQEMNETPIPPPTDEEILKKFEAGQKTTSVELIRFKSRGEADAFRQKTNDPKQWEEELKRDSSRFTTLSDVNLDSFIQSWKLSENSAQRLRQLKSEAISEPLGIGDEFAVLRMLNKETVGSTSLQENQKVQYRDEILNQKRFERFNSWVEEVNERARLKDFTPRPEPAGEIQPA